MRTEFRAYRLSVWYTYTPKSTCSDRPSSSEVIYVVSLSILIHALPGSRRSLHTEVNAQRSSFKCHAVQITVQFYVDNLAYTAGNHESVIPDDQRSGLLRTGYPFTVKITTPCKLKLHNYMDTDFRVAIVVSTKLESNCMNSVL